MLQDSFEQFRQTVLDDPALQAQLQAMADREVFVARVVQLGAEQGYCFTSEDVVAALRENQRVWLERSIR